MRDFDEILHDAVVLERSTDGDSPDNSEFRTLLSLFNDLVVIVAELREHKHQAPTGWLTSVPQNEE